MAQKSEYIPFRGGLDLSSSASELPPGALIYSKNYEAPVDGGYRLIDGYERVDSGHIPSEAQYWIVYFSSGSTEIVRGTSVIFSTTLARAVTCSDAVVSSGSWGAGTAAGYIVLTKLRGVVSGGINITVGGATYAVVNSNEGGAYLNGAITKTLHDQYKIDAIEAIRGRVVRAVDSIANAKQYQTVRGVFFYNENVYALIDYYIIDLHPSTLNATTTDSDISTSSSDKISFISKGGYGPITVHVDSTVSANDYIATDITSANLSASNTILCKIRSSAYFPSGSWQLLLDNTSGCVSPTDTLDLPALTPNKWVDVAITSHSQNSAIISVGLKYISGMPSGIDVTLEIAQLRAAGCVFAKIGEGGLTIYSSSLKAGGKAEHLVSNFGGHSGTSKLYFVYGKGKLCSFNGTTLTEISTGMTTDTPNHIAEYKKRLFLSFPGGSIQFSAAGDPTTWSVISGAGEIAIGEECVGMTSLKGQALAIFGRNKKNVLYGSSSSNFNLTALSETSGAIEWSIQDLGEPLFLDDRGLTSLSASDTYGDYATATWSQSIQKLIDAKKARVTCSVVSRTKSQYRIFFEDGTGLYCTMVNGKLGGIMPIDFGGRVVRGAISVEDLSGNERVFFYSDSSYIYRMDSGNTFDGAAIRSELRLAFNNSKSPITKKRYYRARFDVSAESGTTIQGKSIFSYGDEKNQENPWEDLALYGEENTSLNIEYLDDKQKYAYQHFNFWSTKTSGSSAAINGITHNKKNRWCAVTEDGEIITSPDGDTWTEKLDIATALNGVYFANGYFVAVGNSGVLYTSADDGETWTEQTAAATAAGSAALNDTYFHNGKWAVCGASGKIIYSTNLTSWTAASTPVSLNYNRITHNGSDTWAVCTDTAVSRTIYSYDAETWSAASNSPNTGDDVKVIQFDGAGQWLIANGDKIYSSYVLTSTNDFAEIFEMSGSASIVDMLHTRERILAFTTRDTTPVTRLFFMLDNDLVIERDISFGSSDTTQSLKIGWDGGSRWAIGGAAGLIMMNDLANDDVQYVTEAELPITGNGKNISISLRSQDSYTKPYTIHGVNILYSKRGVNR